MKTSPSALRALFLAAAANLLTGFAFAKSGGKEILISMSWGDQIAFVQATAETPLLTPDSFHKTFHEYKEAGVDVVLFRVDVLRWARDYDWPDPRTLPAYKNNAPREALDADIKQWEGAHDGLKADLLKSIVGIAHEEGLRIFAYSTTFDEGMPLNEIMIAKGRGFGGAMVDGRPWYSKADIGSVVVSRFVEAHPEYVMVDRSQKRHNWGTLEFAYPQARDYAVGYNRWFLENYAFDGVYIDFRNEFGHPEFGDEFGFSPPIVAEYQRRYGVNILRAQFDLEKWRRLCGEYLTEYIRELHSMTHARGKALLVGLPQGNYMGLPNGNMYVDWQGWAAGHMVEGLIIGVYTGKFLYPDQVGYGYLTDMEFGVGLPNLFWDLQNNYLPVCAKNQVKLYVHPRSLNHYNLPLEALAKTGVDGMFGGSRDLKEWKAMLGP